MTGTAWTGQRDALLLKLTAEGRSASRIAAIMGEGLTRNAIVGRWHRLRGAGRQFVVPIRTAPVRKPPPPKRKAESIARPAKSAHLLDVGLAATHFTKRGRSYNKPGPEKPLKLKLAEPVPFNGAGRVTVLDLTSKTCRWPIGDPRSHDFCFCGHEPRFGSPYCEYHARAAYQPMQDRMEAKTLRPLPLPNFNGLGR